MADQHSTEMRLWHMRDREERQRQFWLKAAMIILPVSGFMLGLVASARFLVHSGYCQLP